mgnify:CR=1 FL=1
MLYQQVNNIQITIKKIKIMTFSNDLTIADLYNELKIYKYEREYNFLQKIKNTNKFVLRLI